MKSSATLPLALLVATLHLLPACDPADDSTADSEVTDADTDADADTDTDTDADADTDTDTDDNTAPSVTLLAPTDGDLLAGEVGLEASASDDVSVTELVFALEGEPLHTLLGEPWEASWDSTGWINGSYQLAAVARDQAGNEGSDTIEILLDNEGGLDPESIVIVSPSHGATVCGELTVEAAAADAVQVSFALDGEDRAVADAPPFRWSWDSTEEADGPHRVQATAVDSAGLAVRDAITVELLNDGTDCDALPSVSITAPEPGAWVSGTVELAAEASDDVELIGVQLYADGTLLADDSSAPYSASFDSDAYDEGPHTITAVATDSAAQTAATRITVVADRSAPTVSLVTPAEGDLLQGVVEVQADAEDEAGLAEVELLLDGSSLGVLTAAPYTWSWDTAGAAWGGHDLSVRAVDVAGRVASDIVSVRVDNPPLASIGYPWDGATVSGATTLSAVASDDGGVDFVEFLLDGSRLGRDTSSLYSVDWDSCEATDGSHSLSIEAWDTAGNSVSDSVSFTVVQPLEVDLLAPTGTLRVSEELQATAWTSATISSVSWDVEGSVVATVTTASGVEPGCAIGCDGACDSYSATLDVTTLAQGTHTLTVTATDSTGASASASSSITVLHDQDGDGYDGTDWGGDDCDDRTAFVHPGAREACNGEDDDCDGDVDEDFDADGDGWLDEALCSSSLGGEDCDDSDAAVNPDASEVCDGVDNDCDGNIDVTGVDVSAEYTFGYDSSDWGFWRAWYGNIYYAEADGVLLSFKTYVNPDGAQSLEYSVFESTTETGTYSRAMSTASSSDGSEDWYGPTYANVTITAGNYYLIGVGVSDADELFYDASPDLSTQGGLTPLGYDYDTTYSNPSSMSGGIRGSSLLYQKLTIEGPSPDDLDNDGDGYTPLCGDCDDDDASANPGATELCDGTDNDCDGTVDRAADGSDPCAP
jgi:hypothetical protein